MATTKTLEILLQMKDEATKKMKGFGDIVSANEQKIKSIGKSMTVTGAAITGMTALTVKSASDLGESINAVTVTFGEASEGVLQLSKDAATSVGLSSTAFNGLAVRFKGFSETIAGEGGDVVATLDEMTVRAADFASVQNLEVEQAAQLFQSGLAGQSESLRQFGIDLSAATVTAHAYEVGIAEAGAELTEAQKVQARYSSLLAQTDVVQGDFANTSGSLANQMRILKAQITDASAEIGAVLIPILEEALTHVKPILDNIIAWVRENPKLSQAIIIMTAALGALLLVLGPLLIMLPGIVTAIGLVGTAMAFLAANPIVLIIAALVALGVMIANIIQNWDEFKVFLLAVWEELKNMAVITWDFIKDTIALAVRAIIAGLTGGFSEILILVVNNWDAIKEAISNAWNAIIDTISGFIDQIRSFFTDLASSALQWGQDLIDNFVQGIRNKIGEAKQAAKDVANAVADFLMPGSPTKEGPGKTLPKWGADLVKTVSEGMLSNIGTIEGASEKVAQSALEKFGFNAAQQKEIRNLIGFDPDNFFEDASFSRFNEAGEKVDKGQLSDSDFFRVLQQGEGTSERFGLNRTFEKSARTFGRGRLSSGATGRAGGKQITIVIKDNVFQGISKEMAQQMFDLLQNKLNGSLKT